MKPCTFEEYESLTSIDGALDLAKSPFPYTELGLPEPPADQLPPCGGPLGTPLCTRERKSHPAGSETWG